MSLSHAEVWAGIDRVAARAGLSASGLARKAGLDPTTFNLSKRFSGEAARPRWPSTESVAGVLKATGLSFPEFAALAVGAPPARSAVPLIGFAQAGAEGFFDDAGFPAGQGWDEIEFPGAADEHAYALEIAGDSMAPVFRRGDRIVVSPSAQVRRGDRVVVKTTGGEVMVKELARLTARTVELRSFNPEHEPRLLPRKEVAWIARVVWASQ